MENSETSRTISEEKDGNKDTLQPEGPLEGPQNDNNAANPEPELAVSATINSDEAQWSIWTPRQKKMIILAASFASLLSPLSGQIYFPALNTIATDLHVSDSLVNLSITTYLVCLLFLPFNFNFLLA